MFAILAIAKVVLHVYVEVGGVVCLPKVLVSR